MVIANGPPWAIGIGLSGFDAWVPGSIPERDILRDSAWNRTLTSVTGRESTPELSC